MTTDQMFAQAAELVITEAQRSIELKGFFSLVLSGGSTPRSLYERLASSIYKNLIPWNRVFFFWGDERCVPPDHPDSNYRMAYETLLSHLPIPDENIFRIKGEYADHAAAAQEYENEISSFFIKNTVSPDKTFDLILLGVGADGHTASLFPGDSALHEQKRWVVHVDAPTYMKPRHRITLTLPIINRSAKACFIVSGESKKTVLTTIAGSPEQAKRCYPAAMVATYAGPLWLLDETVSLDSCNE